MKFWKEWTLRFLFSAAIIGILCWIIYYIKMHNN
jgi:hypothetical protein